jgi:esterase/lipase superfamily enzyme
MGEFLFERLALLNTLYRTVASYRECCRVFYSGDLIGPFERQMAEHAFGRVLSEHAFTREEFCRKLARKWKITPARLDREDPDLDDARRRAQSGLDAVAELVTTLEFALAEILNDMADGAIDATSRKQLLADSAELVDDKPAAHATASIIYNTIICDNISVGDKYDIRPTEKAPVAREPEPEPEPAPAHQFEVFFATNRTLTSTGPQINFGSDRSSDIHYGRCAVTIPKTHRIGSIGSPWWHRAIHGDDRLRLETVDALQSDRYWAEIRDRLHETAEPSDAVVFIHGYNVSFLEATLRAAQIGADLSTGGVMAFFSWPSRGTVLGYPADEATIEASEPQITRYLVDLAERSGAGAVHIIAHSMGNRGLLRAVDRIAATAAVATRKPFGQIVLAAPDVDSDTFRALAAAYCRVAARTTLYVSNGDMAVRGSRLLHGASRIGFTPPVALVEGIDTVNVTNVDLTVLGHGYVASARPVMVDIYDLIKYGSDPDDRATLRRCADEDGRPYWEFAA